MDSFPASFVAAPAINVVRRYRGEQQALRWDGHNTKAIMAFCGDRQPNMYRGDWVVRERGIFQVYSDVMFHELFQPAAEAFL